MNNLQFKFNEIMCINCKRKIELEEDTDHYWREKEVKLRREEQHENKNFNLMTIVLYTVKGILRVNKCMNTEWGPNVNKNVGNFGNILIRTMNNLNQNLDSQRTILISS